jgi:Concanavalin A-like lectin/glucanases superfamily/Protein of unknown function (DUF1565)
MSSPKLRTSHNRSLEVCMSHKTRYAIRSLKNVLFTLAVVFGTSIIRSQVDAATYFISPTGSDSNSGNSSSPWKTFGFAIPKLHAGDTLILKNGTYNGLNSGYPNINCAAGASNGTSGNPITISAENERQAYLQGSGPDVFVMNNCSWWIVQGFRISNQDAAGSNQGNLVFNFVTDTTIRRNLVHHSNRNNNVHMIVMADGSRNTIEENEVYDFHRHGIYLTNRNGGTGGHFVRRNYCNMRVAWGQNAGNCIVLYPSSNNVIENNISDTSTGFDMESDFGTTDNNIWLGNISIDDLGYFQECRTDNLNLRPKNTTIKDMVIYNHGLSNRGQFIIKSAENSTISNVTVVGNTVSSNGSFLMTTDSSCPSLVPSFTAKNILVANGAGYGYWAINQNPGAYDYTVSFNNSSNYLISGGSTINTRSSTTNPSLGTCKAWIPIGSPLKGAGAGGSDIGANVLYRYQNGTLTNQPLWDPVTGEFPHGAIVPGINDIAGSSPFDIHKRLNVNTNGCPFPTGYASGTTVASSGVAQTSPSTGPVGYWKFDEGSGTSVSDASGNGSTGSLLNGPVWTTGIKGTALSFDGVDDYVDLGSSPSVNITGAALTLQAWVKGSSPGNYKYIVSKTDGLDVGYGLYTGISGTLRFYVGKGAGLIVTPDVTSPWDNRWHHVVGTYDGSKLNLYIDGVAGASVAATGNIADSSARSLNIGRFSEGGFSFKGVIDDVQIYNRALSSTEIQQLYNAVPVVRPSSPVNLIVTK